MADELIRSEGGELVEVIDRQGIGELLKPLTREIHLFDAYVAGTMHLKDKTVLEALEIDEKLILMREENKFDDNAVLILNMKKQKIGYIPEKDNRVFARLMDAGKLLTARVRSIDRRGSFMQITIGICLVDF